jgi:acyl carrier protein
MPSVEERLEERLKECFSTTFPNLSSDEILRCSTASVANWDSLATVTLVSLIEEEFAITIAPEEYAYIVSFDLVNQCLKSKIVNV